MPLTKHELDECKKNLLELRAELSHQLDVSKKEVASNTDSNAVTADAGTDVEMQTTQLSISSVEKAMLKQIEHALQRLEEGTYGICEDTGNEIPLKRLYAMPLATRTAQAQEIFDKAQKYKDHY